MPRIDPSTEIAQRHAAFMATLRDRVKAREPVGFGKVQMSRREFQDRVRSDAEFRQVMGERMTPAGLSLAMQEKASGATRLPSPGNAAAPNR